MNFKAIKKSYMDKWRFLFDIAKLGDLDRPLTPRILSNADHKITQHLLYIYSMASFIYIDLNKACRYKKEESILLFGAFAAALSYILYEANGKRKDLIDGELVLYRGLKLTELDVKEKYQEE